MPTARAYESDQLTDREVPLADAAPWADPLLDTFLTDAVAATNRRTGCRGTDDEVRARLATEIKRATSRMALYRERGFPASLGFDRYSVALERSAAPRRSFADRDDVFGALRASQALILAAAGPCSTFRLAGVLVGTDKLEHFLASGETAFRWSRGGEDPDRALRRTTHREATWDGAWTSRVFSYADLRANADGLRFYGELLRVGSAFRRDDDGCVAQVRPWSWGEWVDPMWDEVLDPPVFNRNVQRGVDRRIAAEPARYCRAWDALGPEGRAALADPPARVPWAGAEAPVRAGDPFHLEGVCRAPSVAEAHPAGGLAGDEPVRADRPQPLEHVDGDH